MIMNSHPKPETELTRLLRRGDPAAEHGELSPAAVARMRHALLAELETRERRPPRLAWRPLLATAATALVIAVALSRHGADAPPAPRAGKATASRPAPEVAGTAPPPTQVVAAAEPASAAPATGRGARSQPTRLRQSAVKPPAAEALRSARQIDFQTPGGTRVVWVLDPHFSLDHSEVQSR